MPVDAGRTRAREALANVAGTTLAGAPACEAGAGTLHAVRVEEVKGAVR